jgi:hypothetical protein
MSALSPDSRTSFRAAPPDPAPVPDKKPPNALDRLVLLPWRAGLVATVVGLLVSFLLFGFWYPYWRVADMDFWIVYNGFLLNDGRPQEYFEHPGYLSIILLAGCFRFLHAIGLLDVAWLSALPPVKDSAAFHDAWTQATRAGRMLSFLLASGFVLTFGCLIRRLVGDWRVAALATFALAFSGGLAMQLRVIRTELIAAGLATIALLLLLLAARSERSPWRPFMVGAAATLAVLALINKVQLIFVVAAFPLVVLPFGVSGGAGHRFWTLSWRALAALLVLSGIALLAVYAASDLMRFGWSEGIASRLGSDSLIGQSSRAYWLAIAVWVAAGMTAFAVLWRVPVLECPATMAAVTAGAALALLSLHIVYHPTNVAVVFNPIEQMMLYALGSNPELAQAGSLVSWDKLRLLLETAGATIARRTFILQTSPRPSVFLEWFVVAGIVLAFRRGERKLALQAGGLMLAVWGVDTIGMLRGLKQEYFLLTDPLIIIAGALLLARLVDVASQRWAYPIGMTLIVAHVAISQAEPAKHMFKRGGPEELCGLYHQASKAEKLPVCAAGVPKPPS